MTAPLTYGVIIYGICVRRYETRSVSVSLPDVKLKVIIIPINSNSLILQDHWLLRQQLTGTMMEVRKVTFLCVFVIITRSRQTRSRHASVEWSARQLTVLIFMAALALASSPFWAILLRRFNGGSMTAPRGNGLNVAAGEVSRSWP